MTYLLTVTPAGHLASKTFYPEHADPLTRAAMAVICWVAHGETTMATVDIPEMARRVDKWISGVDPYVVINRRDFDSYVWLTEGGGVWRACTEAMDALIQRPQDVVQHARDKQWIL